MNLIKQLNKFCRFIIPDLANLQHEKQIYVKTVHFGANFVSWMMVCSQVIEDIKI